jgi:hypothetical protein
MPAERTLECDLKTEVDFVPLGADFERRLENRSRLCAAQSGLWNATEEVEFRLPCETDFRCDYSSRLGATREWT